MWCNEQHVNHTGCNKLPEFAANTSVQLDRLSQYPILPRRARIALDHNNTGVQDICTAVTGWDLSRSSLSMYPATLCG